MKKLLIIIVVMLSWCGVGFGETVEERLSNIEQRLKKIEELLQPLRELQELGNSLTKNESLEKKEISGDNKTLTMKECLKVTDQKVSVIESNDTFVNYAWIIDYSNSCDIDFTGYPSLEFLDESGFILHKTMFPDKILIPANNTAKAKGTELISPVSKADRISSTSAGLSRSQF